MTLVDNSRRLRNAPLLREQQWLWRPVGVPYRAVLRGVSRVRGIERCVDTETFRWRYPFSEFDADFERPVVDAFRRVVRPGATVFDVGAHFGLYTVVAARHVGSTGKVFAFEPSSVVRVLEDHLRLNRTNGSVEVVPMVVTDKEGQAEFWEPENTRLASLSRRAASREGVGQAKRLIRPATTIDGFCRARGVQPDVLKIDVEGAEWNVLHGARRFLENRRGSILLEVHPQPLADFGATSERLLAELESFGWGAEELYARGRRDDPAATVHYLVEPADG